jgi:hypothetical protein
VIPRSFGQLLTPQSFGQLPLKKGEQNLLALILLLKLISPEILKVSKFSLYLKIYRERLAGGGSKANFYTELVRYTLLTPKQCIFAG